MSAIIRREFRAYFQSPIGYICLAVFWAVSGYSFMMSSLYTGTTDMRATFSMMGTVSMFVIPILTMRLFSEDKRQKTEQALLTAPITLWEMVLGKFISAMLVYLINISISIVFGVVLSALAAVEWPVVVGMYLGTALMGGAMISIGMFISSLTENQIVAAVASFAAMLIIGIIKYIPEMINAPFAETLAAALSFDSRFYTFRMGTLRLDSAVFFLTVQVLFCFFTVRVYEKRRFA